ncbi:hypothetical protein HL658_00080 [Azospirillum sp. RWY-5-1]|uniref:SCP domain-containing protein n=1 Tax=Azospirillum oleiclasticum TaxID=2735135 RepID=A0ABX2T1X6_9PROT|nr:CAP domain-containing protein [Azospirillum oleiclasticum]NYZ10929.1 hypothetical protein [Azospirillum oleiclasticum]NYZ18091.1 hypothetical protein [Azospirillum oleiclasticum]
MRVVLSAMLLLCLTATAAPAMDQAALERLRVRALELVNRDRASNGQARLEPGTALDEAAQRHAEDMLRRDYYSHTSPEGGTVRDRFLAAGGSGVRLVAENIALCEGCPLPPDEARVERLQQGWMDSPGHRRNILAPGIERFGFGIAGGGGRLYAVQTFAGPGSSRGAGEGGPERALDAEDSQRLALDLVNRARRDAGVPPLAGAPALAEAGRAALAAGPEGGSDAIASPFDHLPTDARTRWRRVASVAGRCGGCGTRPTDADVRFFVEQWLKAGQQRGTLLDRGLTHAGFALAARGDGRKTALMTLGGG